MHESYKNGGHLQKVGCGVTHLYLLLCKEYGGNLVSLRGEDGTGLCVGDYVSLVHDHMHIRSGRDKQYKHKRTC